ncbi:MAG: hypothetical protein IJE97_15325 [Thermoguttaceae bacterium]|nr:hypothetical protein [Thermoguttaceae bacterium]
MRKFKDINGVEWTLDVNLATARTFRERMKEVETLKNVDFLDCAAVALALSDVFFAADFLYLLCGDEARSRSVDASAFGAALKGRVLFEATAAATAEYLDFFPDATTVEKARALVEKAEKTRSLYCAAICDEAANRFEREVESAAKKFGVRFSNVAESSASVSETSPT